MKGNIALENLFSHYGGLIIILLAFILYGNTIGHKFALDDEFVVNNEQVKGGVSSIPGIFTSFYSEEENLKYGYRPITRAVFAVEYSIFGMNTKAFHTINVLLYGIACWLLFLFLKRLKNIIPPLLAILTVLLFLFHPVHTEVVNSLKNREEILCLIFSLLSVICFMRFCDKRNVAFLVAGAVLLFIAFLTKETAFVFILIIPLSLMSAGAGRTRIVISTIIAIVVVALAYKLPDIILPPANSNTESWQNPLFDNSGFSKKLSMSMLTLSHYGFQLLIPYKLLFYYGYNTIPLEGFLSFSVIFSLLIHAGLFVIAIFTFRTNKVLSFGIFFYFFAISLFSNIYLPITGIVGDRLIFTASAGFCLILSFVLIKLISHKKLKLTGIIVMAVIFIFYSYKTYSRNSEWKDIKTLYEADIPYLENSVKANDLYASYLLQQANSLLAAGRKPAELSEIAGKAVKHFRIATEIMPEYYNAWNNLGAIYLTFFNDTANALFAFSSAIKYKPELVTAHHNIGYIYYKAKKYQQAKAEYRLALKNDSNYIPSLFSYGEILTIEQRYDSAEKYFLKVYSQDSLNTGVLLNLGSLEIIKGDTLKAIKYFEPAVEKDRTNKALMMNISSYYMKKGDTARSDYYRKMAGQ